MAKTINPVWKKIIFYAVIIILILFLSRLLSGCSVAKQEARKDQAAVLRINANADLQTPVVNAWLKAHPQRPDTIRTTIAGPQIKVPYIVPVPDTARERKIKDSLLAIGKDCGNAALDAYNLGWDECKKYIKENTPIIKCPDYQSERVIDHAAIDRLNDSLRLKEARIANLEGQIAVKDKDANDLTKLATKRLYWMIGEWVLVAIFLILFIYMAVKGGWASIFKKS